MEKVKRDGLTCMKTTANAFKPRTFHHFPDPSYLKPTIFLFYQHSHTQMESPKIDRRRFALSSFYLLFFICILASINEARYATLFKITQNMSNASSTIDITESNPPADKLRILMGILTLPDQYNRRHFLRLIYGTQSPVGAKVDVKFIFCNLTKEDQRILVALEIMRYNDIIILNCTENMNKGKTYTYFSSLPEMLNDGSGVYPPYHYVMKADDDAYFRLNTLVETLLPLPREDLYYGYVIPCPSMDPFKHYMSGMGYLISWDLVEWITESPIPRNHLEGPEDRVFGEWIKEGGKGKNRFNAKWWMYNYPEPPTRCTHELWPQTVAVHLLKNQQKWIKTLKYFNVTKNLEPSKLYHID